MQGLDDDDWDDDFRPAPHPDDRLWRHPAEIAAEARAAAIASAETIEVPTLSPPPAPTTPPRRRLVAVAAVSALLVGGTALLAGTLTRPEVANNAASPAAQPAASSQTASADAQAQRAPAQRSNGVQPIIAAAPSTTNSMQGSSHAQLAASLPKIQVVTDAGMTEGSGFFLTPSGHIATSARLLRNAEYVIVWTEGNLRYPADILGADTFSDVALIKIESGSWPAADVAESSALYPDQPALTLDHEHNIMVVGHVASPFGTIRNEGQPSTPRVLISEAGPAGSAILDEAGAIVAMSNGLTNDPSGEVIATPAWLVQRVALDMLVSGNSSHAWLGAEFAGTGPRVTITEVEPRSPAENHGLRVGDQIEYVDDTPIESLEALMRSLYTQNPGDEIRLMIVTDDARRIVPVTLGSLFD